MEENLVSKLLPSGGEGSVKMLIVFVDIEIYYFT